MGAEDSLLGIEVGNFRLVRLLGRGGMGRVYLGVHESIGSRVAIKVLAEDLAGSEEILERFFTEARAVNLIHHENIVAISDLDRLPGGRPYIVMEFVEGKTLRDLLQASPGLPLPLGGSVRAVIDVLHALEAAHVAGIIHRDLKPDNVILTASGRAKVLDFGIAKLVDGPALRTATGVLLGTPHYMAPEQILGSLADGRTDVYAVGVMLFELITGGRPFDAPSDFALMQAQVQMPAPIARAVPAAIADIVAQALAKAPVERFATAQAMADALTAALDSLDDATAPPFSTAALKVVGPSTSELATAVASPRPRSSQPSATAATRAEGPGSAPVAIPTPTPRRSSAGTLLAVGAIVAALLGAAVIVAVALGRRSATPSPPRDAAMTAIAILTRDAEAPSDAVVDAPLEAVALDASAVTLDAAPTRLVAHPPPLAVRGTSIGRACALNNDCPRYNCQCGNQFVRANTCVDGTCQPPSKMCPLVCKTEPLKWTGAFGVMEPRTDADCAISTDCKRTGQCVLRWEQDPGTAGRCVSSCQDSLSACINDGRCADGPNHTCIATEATCAAHEHCKDVGTCGVRDDKCVSTPAGCLASNTCHEYGACAVADNRCVALDDASCRASSRCSLYGACAKNGTRCSPAGQADCEHAAWCATDGFCTYKDHDCVATAESCRASKMCKVDGQCVLVGESCERPD